MSAAITRHTSGYPGLDRAFGGGMVRGSLSLFAGEPEVSDLLRQVACEAGRAGARVLYIRGTRDGDPDALRRVNDQLAHRARRLAAFLLMEAPSWDHVRERVATGAPNLIVVDSLEQLATRDGPADDRAAVAALRANLWGLAHPAAGPGAVVLARRFDALPDDVPRDWDADFVLRRWADETVWLAATWNRYGLPGAAAGFRPDGAGNLAPVGEMDLTPWTAAEERA